MFLGRLERKEKKKEIYIQYRTQKREKTKRTIKEKHLHFCFPPQVFFFLAFLEKRYTVASYQSRITCRYNTT